MGGKRVFLEREEVMVTIVLDAGGNEEHGDADESAQRGWVSQFDIVKG